MDSFYETIDKFNMLTPKDSVIIALSGGADSVVLTHLLLSTKSKLSLSLRAAHVNHGLRGEESDGDEAFVRMLCDRLEIELDTVRVDVKAEAEYSGTSVEEAGRRLRYSAFEEVRKKYGFNKIAVAHNKNDNAETLLMWILRGAGLKGLCGIPPFRGNIIRPLLGTGRDEIEKYCAEKNIDFRTDRSNFENIYNRNKLRLNLIPLLRREYNPDIVSTLTRMSETLSKDNEYIEEAAVRAFGECILPQTDEGELRLSLSKLKICHEAIAVRVVRIAAAALDKDLHDLYRTHYESIIGLMAKQTGKKISLPHGMYAMTEYDSLIMGISQKKESAPQISYTLTPEIPVYIKEFDFTAVLSQKMNYFECGVFSAEICTKEFSYDRMNTGTEIRNRRPGDKIYVAGMGGNKKIKDYFTDTKLASRLRDSVPLAACGSDILWIIDDKNITSDKYKGEENRPKAYIHIMRRMPDSERGVEENDREKHCFDRTDFQGAD